MPKVVTLYKITKADRSTYGGFVWPIGKWQTFSGIGPSCSPGWSHWCETPQIALMMGPMYGYVDRYARILWRGEGVVGIRENTKIMCARARIIEPIEVPEDIPTDEQRIIFAILCGLECLNRKKGNWVNIWASWAQDWLSGDPSARQSLKILEYLSQYSTGSPVQRTAMVAALHFARGDYVFAAEFAAAAAKYSGLDIKDIAYVSLLPWEPQVNGDEGVDSG